MRRTLRFTGWALGIALLLTSSLLGVLLVLPRTEWGAERIRRTAITQIAERIDGTVHIGRVEASRFLGAASFHDLSLTDPRGRTFVELDSVHLRYGLRTLLAGDIVLRSVDAFAPRLFIERLPAEDRWNTELIFPPAPSPAERRLVRFENVRVTDGLVVVRTPWTLPAPADPTHDPRFILQQVADGLVREFRFEQVQARFPRITWETPAEPGQFIEVASLATQGYIWTEPFELRDLNGVFMRRDSVLEFDVAELHLPASHAAATGSIVIAEPRASLDIDIRGFEIATADLKWLYPPLPDEARGSLDFRIQTQQPVGTLWLATGAHVLAAGTELRGSFGIVVGDTIHFTQVDLVASPLDVALIKEIFPLDLPVAGLLAGTVAADGPPSALTTSGQLTFSDAPHARTAAVSWNGILDLRAPFAAQRLRANVENLDLALLSGLHPTMLDAGSVSGRIDAAARRDRTLDISTALQHRLPGFPDSRLTADGQVGFAPRQQHWAPATIDAHLEIETLSLDALASLFPALDRLGGQVSGPVDLAGPPADLEINTDLQTPIGRLDVQGTLSLGSELPRYSLRGRISELRPEAVIARSPDTEIAANFQLDGAGVALQDLRSRLSLELDSMNILGLPIPKASLRLAADDGIATIDSLLVQSAAADLDVAGSFGMIEDRRGSLQVEIRGHSLAALQPLLAGDTEVEGVRSLPPELGGRFRIDAAIEGGLADFNAQGTASFDELSVGPLFAMRAALGFSAAGLGATTPRLELHSQAEEITLFHRPLSLATLRADHGPDGGSLTLDASAPGERYRLSTGFSLEPAAASLQLSELTLEPGARRWSLASPTTLRLDDHGFHVQNLILARDAGSGRVSVSGTLPWLRSWPAGPNLPQNADFAVHFEDVDLADFTTLISPAHPLQGMLNGSFLVEGVAESPLMTAELTVDRPRFRGLELERLISSSTYADRDLDLRIDAWLDGRGISSVSGRIPLDLTLAAVETRRLDSPLAIAIRFDSLPAALPAGLLDDFYAVDGYLDGTLTATGTLREPELGGLLLFRDGSAGLRSTRMRYRDLQATFRLLGGRRVVVQARGRGNAGTATVEGSIDFAQLGDPAFDLVLVAREFEAARRRDVELTATGEVRLQGHYSRPIVHAGLRIDRGALFLDELARQYQIVELESPFLLDLVDPLTIGEQRLPAQNPFLQGLQLDASFEVGRDLWLRSPEMNIELTGEVSLSYDSQVEDVRLTGALNVARGTYRLRGRRFDVREGTVDFVGTPGIDPNLDITAIYRVRTTYGAPLEIRALLTGTLQDMRISLASDAEPPLSESDLFSYVFFGRPTYALAPSETHALGLATAGLGLGVRAVGPHVLGYAAAGLETVAQSFGLDFVSITAADEAFEEGVGNLLAGNPLLANLLAGTQVELRGYVADNLFLAYTQRLAGATPRHAGARVEWRFHPTWSVELFVEDRFARMPVFGLEPAAEPRKIFGFSLFRNWNY